MASVIARRKSRRQLVEESLANVGCGSRNLSNNDLVALAAAECAHSLCTRLIEGDVELNHDSVVVLYQLMRDVCKNGSGFRMSIELAVQPHPRDESITNEALLRRIRLSLRMRGVPQGEGAADARRTHLSDCLELYRRVQAKERLLDHS